MKHATSLPPHHPGPSPAGANRGSAILAVGIVALQVAAAITIAGCATVGVDRGNENRLHYPINNACPPDGTGGACKVSFFSDKDAIAARDPAAFPRRYLELWDPAARRAECVTGKPSATGIGDADCLSRLTALSGYFNPLPGSLELRFDDRGVPNADIIGVALEGGGNKAGPFALGVLAGLQEAGRLNDKVGAISSVSGGSYAASFYFNRVFDFYAAKGAQKKDPIPTDVANAWFNSCIPDHYRRNFGDIASTNAFPGCGETGRPESPRFHKDFKFQEQVWTHHDLLMLDNAPGYRTQDDLRIPELLNAGALVGMSAASAPFQVLSRTLFRWPVNSAPSKLAYKLGIEREYGYSPEDWERVMKSDDGIPVWWRSIERRRERTLSKYSKLVPHHFVPQWIIGTTAPGDINATAWLTASPRDPVRHQFEITPTGFGSGIYGYARAHPDAPYDISGPNPDGLPIVDAVVASAAFFDDNQLLISKQPMRLLAGALQQFANVTWFSEIRNFNMNDESRAAARVQPWPLYLKGSAAESETPYIHLQDGGNAENTGIFPLLRRGYKTIIYAHGTQDPNAEFAAICHLKNQLELDGSYYLVSADLEAIVARLPISPEEKARLAEPRGSTGKFSSYLDQLCTTELDASDLLAFDDNKALSGKSAIPAVAKLYCGRLGLNRQPVPRGPARGAPQQGRYDPCPEFEQRFHALGRPCSNCEDPALPRNYPVFNQLFFQWNGSPLRFHVCRADDPALGDASAAAAPAQPVTSGDKLLSTIVAVVPAIDWSEARRQLGKPFEENDTYPWNGFCAVPIEERRKVPISYCGAPNGTLLSTGQPAAGSPGYFDGLPCTALARLLENQCQAQDSPYPLFKHPIFPQSNFISETFHSSYTRHASYFDLGRFQVQRALRDLGVRRVSGAEACAEVGRLTY